jgi:hypothetical protein
MELKKLFSLLIFLLSGSGLLLSQPGKQKELFAVNAGAGVLTFHGDVGKSTLVGSYSFIRSGYSLSAEKYFSKNFSVSLGLLNGKIARDEKASDLLWKRNFETFISQIGISGTFYAKGKKEQLLIPYFSAGFSILSFSPSTDLADKNGNYYNYWKDGSVKDLPDTGMNYFYAQNIERDYNYETSLTDSNDFSLHAFALPFAFGLKIKLTQHADINLGFSYQAATTDYLDGLKAGGNDNYLFTHATLSYHIFTLPKEEKEKFSNIDFAGIDKTDSDKDGIPDENDLCAGTPKGVKTDSKGCPLDADADGVPDYRDKEPHSKNGLAVDVNGVELTKERMAQLQKEQNAAAELHSRAQLSENFNKKPSAEFMKLVEEMQLELRKNPEAKTPATVIPYDLRVADWNKDGFIASDEIAKTIDAFFDGSINFSAEQIHRLIDFFFEQ